MPSSGIVRHGHAFKGKATRTYRAWAEMLSRCTNPNVDSYHRYGAKGITVCERWKDFALFLEDLGECPDGLTIDRIDNSKGYEPGNCQWATRAVQAQNRSSTKLTARDVRWIRYLIERGEQTRRSIANAYEINYSTVERIMTRKIWANV